MKTAEYYVKVEVKTKADLPEDKDRYYLCCINEYTDYEYIIRIPVKGNTKTWEMVDWYLLPVQIELPSDDKIKELANKYADIYWADVDTLEKQMKHNVCIVDFIVKAKWMRDQIKQQMK